MKLHNGKGRRILSIVLCLLMVLALLPAAALADNVNGGQSETFDITIKKVWNDEGNADKRPEKITVNLLKNGLNDGAVNLTADGEWETTINKPVNDDAGKPITYTVTEDPIENYVATITQQPKAGSLTVGKWSEKRTPASNPSYDVSGNIIVAKEGNNYYVWTIKGLNNAQKLKLLAAINAAQLDGLGKELSENNTEFQSGLPATFNNGDVSISQTGDTTQITFKGTNVWSLFYEGTLTIEEAQGAIITNTYTPTQESETGTLDISKEIKGLPREKWPTEIEFKVTDTNNPNKTYTVAVKKNNGLYEAGTINDLPYGEYTVEEVNAAVDGYTLATEINPNKITIDENKKQVEVYVTNTYMEAEPKKGELTISKRANGLSDGQLPTSFTFEIMQGNNPIQQVTAKREGNDNTYKSDPIMLPYGEYTVVEKGAEIQGFILNATSDPADGKVTVSEKPQTIAFTNTYEMMNPEAGTLIVKKTVSGDGADYNKAFTFTVELKNPEFIVIPADPLHNNPAPSASPQPVVAKYGDVEFINGKATFTLKHNEKKTMTGIPAGMTYTVTESDNAGYTVTVNGTKETTATGKIESGKTAAAAFNNYKAGNNYTDTTFVYVNKVWMDGGSVRRPNSVTVQLYCNGKPYSLTMFGRVVDDGRAVLSAANGWQYTWRGLDDRYNWTVGEVDVPYGYVCNVTHGGNYWTITNTAVSGVLPPQTGDNNSTTLWLALLLISGSALAGTVVFIRRRKRT